MHLSLEFSSPMARLTTVIVPTIAMILFIGVGPAQAQDEPVAYDKIPKVVMDALLARFPQA